MTYDVSHYFEKEVTWLLGNYYEYINKEAINKDRVVKVAELRTVLRGRKGAHEMRRTPPLNLWNLWRDWKTKLIPRPGGQCQQHGKLNPTHYATGGPTMPVGPVSGETVDNLLISSVAANTQAHETTAVHQPDPTSDWLWRRSLTLFWVILEIFKQVFVTKPWDYLISNYVDYFIIIIWFEESRPVEGYHNIQLCYIGTVFSRNRKYIFRKKKKSKLYYSNFIKKY